MKIYESLKTKKLSLEDSTLVINIEKYGFGIINVFEDENGPCFSYSIGLYDNYNHPEILVIGLPAEVSQAMINELGASIKNDHKYATNKSYDDVLDGFQCVFRKVSQGFYEDYLGWAMWYYDNKDFPVIQCVWPDKNHSFPWDSEFSENLKFQQPILE